MGVSRRALFAGFSLPPGARGAAGRRCARVALILLPLELRAGRGAHARGVRGKTARPRSPASANGAAAERREVGALHRKLPRPMAEAAPNRGERSGQEALSGV